MNDAQTYNMVKDALYEEGSCKVNTWYTIFVNDEPKFEASINVKGFLHIRKPIKKLGDHSHFSFMYEHYKFNSKKEFKYNGLFEGNKPDQENFRKIKV